MILAERGHELSELETWAAKARAGHGGAVLVCGESGGGKTAFVETFIEQAGNDVRVLWGACDPLSTPRPLGPLRDLEDRFDAGTRVLLRGGEQPYEIFAAVFDDLRTQPTILVVDDLHWADQGTIDLFRFLLRRAPHTHLLLVGIARDDEVGVTHPLRGLLGDVARSAHAQSLTLPPLSPDAVATLVGDRTVDPTWLHRVTGGNAFFVCEMLDHRTGELPTTVRDAILARTAGLDAESWDLLNLLTCAPGAIADHLLTDLGVTLPALRSLDDAKLIRRDDRGVAFRHDLCRLAITSVIPPGAEPGLHRRFIHAHRAASHADPAVITHHALGAGDRDLVTTAAAEAGRAATRSGAHTQATEFFRIALKEGDLPSEVEAELLELLATEYYLTDCLDEAIAACRRAKHLREAMRADVAVSADHHSLAVYEWYNANRAVADDHVATAIAVLEDRAESDEPQLLTQLGHAFAFQAFLAVQSSRLDAATRLLRRAREIAGRAHDPLLNVRIDVVGGVCEVLTGHEVARDELLEMLGAGPRLINETYSSGYTALSYFDVEQRRLRAATELLDVCLPLMVEHDLPICHVVQLGSRSRLKLLVGDWDGALVDADAVLDRPSAPLAHTWPLLIRALVSLRRSGDDLGGIDAAWRLANRFGEPVRILPVAAAIAEKSWLTGVLDARLDECRSLLTTVPVTGLEWSRAELATWLCRVEGTATTDTPDTAAAEPYRLLASGKFEAAAGAFDDLSTPYDAALAMVDSGDAELQYRALDLLDRLGADAVAAKVRQDLRARGVRSVPAPRRATTLANPAGLTTRQIEVLRLLENGLTNAELAEQLFLSVKTVDHHVSAILTKLQVSKRRDAVRRAREIGILR
ncbi:AAA family ATPase [Aldersonia sp. NBC_00410]|uniref:ATP-binding protein n=1 Tax=Aldersonia sp. NBC_00410 TaxID=2975954 RepID=UPI00224F0C8D|nr:helix-turn-helix transcriptional regulator [Aldersonia sp. NBC_00410]MCX5045435.1 AAA family ATPase [Aldersonia sp. NBC_00410]